MWVHDCHEDVHCKQVDTHMATRGTGRLGTREGGAIEIRLRGRDATTAREQRRWDGAVGTETVNWEVRDKGRRGRGRTVVDKSAHGQVKWEHEGVKTARHTTPLSRGKCSH